MPKTGFSVIAGLAKRRAGWLLLGIAALIGVDLLQLLVPRVIKFAVDDLTAGTAGPASLLKQAGMVLALALGMALLRLLWRPILMGFARTVEKVLRTTLLAKVHSLHLGFFHQHSPGTIMARATNDLGNIRMAVGMGLVAAMDGLAMTLFTLGFMIYISPALTALALLPMPFIVWITRVMSRRMQSGYLKAQESFASMTELVREALSGIRMVKAYGLKRREQGRLEESAQGLLRVNMDLARLHAILFPLMVLLTSFSLAVVLGAGGPLTVWGRITPGDFVAFASYLTLLTWPMMALGWVMSLIQRAVSSLKRLDQILLAEPRINDPAAPAGLPAGRMDIVVRGLTFSYGGQAGPVLRGVSLEARAGRATALVGPIGSGKSTLLALLGRLYDPPPGSVTIGGVDLLSLSQAELRGHLVQVPQEAFFFSTTVRDNLTLGMAEPPGDDDLWQVLEEVELAAELRELPKGLGATLGEKGHNLSGGQRQRLALARALLHRPPALLLDDPLSAVDTETERRILANLGRIRAGRTTLLVSHRLASVAFAEHIYVLDQGRVVEHGSHQELLDAGGLYHRLFAEQALLARVEGG